MRIPHGLRAALASQGAAPPSAYQIQRSLRFNSADSAYLSRTPASAGNRKTWTWSGWVKRSGLGQKYLFGAASNSSNYAGLYFNGSDQITFVHIPASNTINLVSTQVFRDVSAWYHVVCSVDTTQAVSSNGVKIYVNGVLVTLSGAYTQNADTIINSLDTHGIGSLGSVFIGQDGYLADIHFIDGQALTPTSFAETNATTGQWVPKAYTGSYDNLLKISSSAYSTSGTPWNSSREWNDFFAQTLSDAVYAAVGTTHTVTFSPALTVSSEVKITKWSAQGIASSNYVLNGSITRTSGNFTNHVDTISSATLGGSLSSISLQTVGGSDAATVVELTVDGKPVRLNTVNGNGFHLDFADNSNNTAGTLGKDTSGNGLNWTPSGFSVTAGAGNDSLVDTPTSYGTDTGAGGEVRGNYATLNPLLANATLANGNLDISGGAADFWRHSTIGCSSGKWYAEMTVGSSSSLGLGIYSQSALNSSVNASQSRGYFINGQKYSNGSLFTYGNSFTTNDVIGIAFDVDAGKVWFSKNGAWQASGDPVAGTNAAFTDIANNTWFVTIQGATFSASANFGQRPFAYTAPSGFKALCDTNLPTPAIAQPNTVMDVLTYTGNGVSGRNITGLSFNPDLVWIKSRSGSNWHNVVDSVRGASRDLFTNATNAEALNDTTGTVSAFNSDGFTLTAGSVNIDDVNGNSSSYVAWCWDAGSSTVTNTQGSITSSVRANTSAGFSIVTYTGTGASATVGHGLGVAPSFVIVKRRDSTSDWCVWSKMLYDAYGASYFNFLNDTAGATNNASVFNGNTSSTTFPVATNAAVNGSGGTYVAYGFAPIANYSVFGSYTGNGSTDGSFVYTGFAPAFVLIKRTDTTSNWTILDYKREGYNVDNDPLYSNLSNAEGTTDLLDITSNGFKLRSTDTSVNASSGTYIYAAFAQNPLQYARAR